MEMCTYALCDMNFFQGVNGFLPRQFYRRGCRHVLGAAGVQGSAAVEVSIRRPLLPHGALLRHPGVTPTL